MRQERVKQSGEDRFIEALKRGEEWAYERLYDEYAPKIGGIAKSYLGYDDVDDVVQEVMMRIYKGIRKFRGDSKLSTWIHRIAVNVCKDMLSKRRKHKEVLTSFSEEDDETDFSYVAFVDDNTLEETLEEFNYESIMKAIEKLSSENRLLIKLRDVDGLSYEEIAKILGKPIGTVKSRLHYARKKLRELIEGGKGNVGRKT